MLCFGASLHTLSPDGVSRLELGICIRNYVYAYAIYNVRPRFHLRLIFHLLAGGEERGRKHADPVGGLSVARSDPPARGTDRGHRYPRLASRRGAELETPGSVQLPPAPRPITRREGGLSISRPELANYLPIWGFGCLVRVWWRGVSGVGWGS